MENFTTDAPARNGAHPTHSPTAPDNAHSIGHSNGTAPATVNGYPDVYTPQLTAGELAPHHREILGKQSSISADAIEARGYFTTQKPAVLEQLGFSKGPKGQAAVAASDSPVMVIPLFNWRGELAGHVDKPDVPRTDKATGKKIKYEAPKGAPVVIDVAPLTRDQIGDISKPIIFTEGAKKADAAASRGLCAVNLAGVNNFTVDGAPHPDLNEIPLKGRVAVIAYDADVTVNPTVQRARRRLCTVLQNRGALVKVVDLAPGPKGEKTGLDDFFAGDGTVEQLFALARDLEPVAEEQRKKKQEREKRKREELAATGLPSIETGDQQQETQIKAMAEALAEANRRAPHLFHGPQGLSRISFNKDGRAVIVPATAEIVQDAAAKAANWIHTSEREGIRNTAPPKSLCSIYAQTPHNWREIYPIDTVVTAPFFAPDGTLCATPGYHASAGTWLDWPENLTLPDSTPTPARVAAARELVLDTLLGEVAFADNASRAHAVALMLLPLVRRMIPDCGPIHLWDAPVQSSGKSYGAEVCIEPYATPEPMDDIADEAEWAKSIFTKLLEGRSHLFFDNIKGRLSSASLSSYVTSKAKSSRILGGNRTATVSTLGAIWIATSNNARLDRDAQSRSLLIRLDTGLEQPEDRQYRSDPKAFIHANRAAVIAALVTLVRHWQESGCPAYEGNKSRFKAWSRIIGGILAAADIPGFLENTDEARDTLSPETDAWREFVGAWFEAHGDSGITAKDLLPLALKCDGLTDLIGEKEGQAKRLGNLLNARRDQVFTNFKISRDSQKTKFGAKWRLIVQKDPENAPQDPKNSPKGDTGDTGDTSLKRTRDPRNSLFDSELEIEIEKARVNIEWLEPVSPVSPVSPFANEAPAPVDEWLPEPGAREVTYE